MAAVLDLAGRLVAIRAFPATRSGYARLVEWVSSHGIIDRIGIEGTGSWGPGRLTLFCLSHGLVLLDVDRPDRRSRRANGKTDEIDAEAPHAPFSQAEESFYDAAYRGVMWNDLDPGDNIGRVAEVNPDKGAAPCTRQECCEMFDGEGRCVRGDDGGIRSLLGDLRQDSAFDVLVLRDGLEY